MTHVTIIVFLMIITVYSTLKSIWYAIKNYREKHNAFNYEELNDIPEQLNCYINDLIK